jgi:eukaryotic-like serine/threonine-protein kinase
MSTERFHRLESLFAEALVQPADSRASFLARTCGGDDALRNDVLSLLTAAEQSGNFLGTPALDVLARRIASDGGSLQRGDRLGAYIVDQRLGSGGMGEVWRARDERLSRDVAIKVLLPYFSGDADRVRRFHQEARAASALNHTNVLTVYDVGEHGGAPYLVTECLDGEALRTRLAVRRLTVDEVIDIALQMARGLAAAHARGIVHRDLKPDNVFLVRDGRLKILDFGLAKLLDASAVVVETDETRAHTRGAAILGTAGYMAPEQALGGEVDARADVFAVGAVVYEMLAGFRAFQGVGAYDTLKAIITNEPAEISTINPDVPPALSTIVHRCLEKSPDMRFSTAGDLATALEEVARERQLPPPPSSWTLLRRPKVLMALFIVVLAITGSAWRWWTVAAHARWARTVAAPEIQRLVDQDDYVGAFGLARQALEVLPDDPLLRQLWLNVSVPMAVTGEPAGADVAFKPYGASTVDWYSLGRTPLEGIRTPRAMLRFKISKAGFVPVEVSGSRRPFRYHLDSVDAAPPGMVRVLAGGEQLRYGIAGDVDDYWIDRFEVTNRQYKQFVDQGGYRQAAYWRQAFVDGSRTLSWDEAIARFRDTTGHPGPATWANGTYPEGQSDFPVGGVSWYEAAAYAEFSGKSLPTLYHWHRAAGVTLFAEGILVASNFSANGPVPVGSRAGLGPFGTYDMAGNVKEWCWNEAGGLRFLMGGAWNELPYVFSDYDAKPPFDRHATYGFRLAKYIGPVAETLSASIRINTLRPDVGRDKPVSAEIFEIYRRQYGYDRGPLNAVIEAREDAEFWRKETVMLDAAYGGERFRAHLYLPKNVSPPYQTVVYFPGGDAFHARPSRDASLSSTDFIIRSGRALLYPVYKGTYERAATPGAGFQASRELRIAWYRDLGRSIDYLETRQDIDQARIGFHFVSGGTGVILSALEPRFKVSVLQAGGLVGQPPPEIDPINFAPRVRVPTLMVNGRYDFELPVETAQRPLFDLLGPPSEHKNHVVLEGGHLPWRRQELVDQVLAWLDRYLGPVSPR